MNRGYVNEVVRIEEQRQRARQNAEVKGILIQTMDLLRQLRRMIEENDLEERSILSRSSIALLASPFPASRDLITLRAFEGETDIDARGFQSETD